MTTFIDREKKILEFIQNQGTASIQELVEAFSVSNMTIHRELNKLKNMIPVRTFTEWDEERPGFMEIDRRGALWEHHRRAIPEHVDLYRHFDWLDRCYRSVAPLTRGSF